MEIDRAKQNLTGPREHCSIIAKRECAARGNLSRRFAF